MKKSGEQKEKTKEEKTTRKTQWCSGITCVLAELRAHYPEHHQQRETEEDREEDREDREDKRRDQTPLHFHRHSTTHNTTRQHTHHTETHTTTHKEMTVNTTRPSAPHNHHPYPIMTQPCHKDTTLNQQCCDREHKDGKREREGRDTITPPHFPIHNKHSNTQTEEERGQHKEDADSTTRGNATQEGLNNAGCRI